MLLSNRILQMLTISWLGNGTKNIAAHPHFRSRFLTYLERRDNPLEFIREYVIELYIYEPNSYLIQSNTSTRKLLRIAPYLG